MMPRCLTIPVLVAALVLVVMSALPARAQVPATLVADRVTVAGEVLTAEGNVEVFFDGTRLTAARVRYDGARDLLTIEGPILITGPDGEILTADRAELSPELRAGLLLGARLVLDRQLQLAAGAIERGGPVSRLTRVAATSCHVCNGRPPLWEIRAETVTHDEIARQLWFENAQLRIRGVPVFWVPRMRLPDPSLDRARGLLVPRIVTTDQLSSGIKLPYFIPFGDSRDLTLTPYLSSRTTTLEARYRQAFARGDLTVSGAISRDDLRADATRGYLFAEGDFRTESGTRIDFDLQLASDESYLLDYGISNADQLTSNLTATRVTASSYLSYGLVTVRSLRPGDVNDELPGILPYLTWERRLITGSGGILTLTGSCDAAIRPSTADGTGRDTTRFSLGARWQDSWITSGGLVFTGTAALDWDHYLVAEDTTYPASLDRWTASADVTLRYPLVRSGRDGSRQVLEPVVQLSWAQVSGDTPPNEDSTVPEFDEGNLFALSRFPGEDRIETGPSAAIGLTWSRFGPAGGSARLTLGRVWRETADPDLTSASGLDGPVSDWLVAGSFASPDGLRLDARAIFDPDFGFDKSAARLGWSNDRVDLGATYVFVPADPAEDRAQNASEWNVDASYRLTEIWTLGAEARYDLVSDSPAFAAIEIGYRNECVAAELSVSRRFTGSASVEPTTSLGLSVELLGFSAGRPARGARAACAS